jgi:hypothetical protein
MVKFNKTNQSSAWKFSTPSKKPAIDEKTTLTANLALVISKKSV